MSFHSSLLLRILAVIPVDMLFIFAVCYCHCNLIDVFKECKRIVRLADWDARRPACGWDKSITNFLYAGCMEEQ